MAAKAWIAILILFFACEVSEPTAPAETGIQKVWIDYNARESLVITEKAGVLHIRIGDDSTRALKIYPPQDF